MLIISYDLFVLIDGVLRHFQQYFSYIVAVSCIAGEKLLTCRKSLTNFIT